MATAAARAGKPVVATYLTRRQPPLLAVPAYRFPEDGVRALARAAHYAVWRNRQLADSPVAQRFDVDSPHSEPATGESAGPQPIDVDPPAVDPPAGHMAVVDSAAVSELIERVLAGHPDGVTLEGGEAADLLQAAGLSVARQAWVTSRDEAVEAAERIGWPVALKAGGRPAVARTEATGLALDLAGAEELAGVWTRMEEALGPGALRRALVQAMVAPGVNAQVLAVADALLGPVVALGRGGVGGSRPGDLAVRLAPFEGDDAALLVDASPLGVDADAVPAVGRRALEGVLGRVAALVADHPEVVEVQLDPLLVSDTAVVTDLRVGIQPLRPSAFPLVRRI